MATRWGCLGPGKITADFFTAVKENLPSTEHKFVAVGSSDKGRAHEFAEKFGFQKSYGTYEEVANDPDIEVVYIGTLNTTHGKLAKLMLNGGKHVLCEKPMAMNYKEAKEVLDLAKSKDLFYMEGMWSRFLPVYDEIRKELASGSLGDVKLVQANFCVPISHVPRVWDLALGGGGMLDIGLYALQNAVLVQKKMPDSITAVGNLLESGADEGACVLLKYADGMIANLTYCVTAKGSNKLEITGTKGRLEVAAPFWCSTTITTPSGTKEFPLKDGEYNFCNSAGLQFEAAAVRECLVKGKKEHDFMSHEDSEILHKIMTEVRKQIGMKYPDFD